MATRRTIKNIVHNYTDAQVKVRDATSNDPWGPSSSLMSEIAHLTYNVMAFSDIMSMIWRRLNDHGKNWRHVYKSLVLLEYIIKTGSERVAQQCRENIFAIQTLKDFEFIDKDGKDTGLNVREKSKSLVALLKDEERLKQERVRALKAQERFAQASQGIGSSTVGKTDFESSHDSNQSENAANTTSATPPRSLSTDMEQARPQTSGEEELQLQLALAMSREEAEQKEKEVRSDDIRLKMALDESKEIQAPAGSQQATTLLNLASDPKWSPPAAQDPWGAPAPATSSPAFNNTQASVTVNDPWKNPSPAHKNPPPQGSPWGASPPLAAAVPASDPWGAPPAAPAPAPAPADPWGGVAAPAPATTPAPEPWGSAAPAPTKSDPWSINGGGAAPDPDAEFDKLRVKPVEGAVSAVSIDDSFFSAPVAVPSSNSNAFDMTGMDQALGSTPDKKKPEDFLGKNSKLVNLESLIGPTRETVGQPSMQGTNPFMSVLGGAPPPVSTGLQAQPLNNPFQQQRMPAPTINQMRAQPVVDVNAGFGGGGMGMGGGMAMGGGTTLPPPLLPASSGPSPAQQQAQTNPFLL
ncbi:epsin-2-like [Lytechinus variegatus]|uniref:epsin-2-like n=1 Tax=Lytechinus variegatus TaxID=7654 RepID=UPI001BB29AAB|nr:epsin-2-like [Lytechinus variegatus]